MKRATMLSLVCLASVAVAKDGEWGKDVTFTTDWKKAIKEARNTGKILFIYNGWQGANI